MTSTTRAAAATAAGYRLREPGPGDATELGRLHVTVWQEAYAGIAPAEYLARMDPDASIARWARRLANEDGPPRLVAVAPDGRIAGFVSWGPGRDQEPPSGLEEELQVINVLRAHHGSGVADLMIAASIGERPCWLWVAERNARARAFYTRLGFNPDGATTTHPGCGIAEIRMVRTAGS